MKIPCPFCDHKILVTENKETQFTCVCDAYASVHLQEDAYLFESEAAQALGLNPTEYVEGGGYVVAENPNRFMEIRDAGTIFDDGEYNYVMQWAERRKDALPMSVTVKEFSKLYALRWSTFSGRKWVSHASPSVPTIGRWALQKRGGIEWGFQPHARMWLIYTKALDIPPPKKGRPI